MNVTEELHLIQKAKRFGGDKYESKSGMIIYVPQHISREDMGRGEPRQLIKVTFEDA